MTTVDQVPATLNPSWVSVFAGYSATQLQAAITYYLDQVNKNINYIESVKAVATAKALLQQITGSNVQSVPAGVVSPLPTSAVSPTIQSTKGLPVAGSATITVGSGQPVNRNVAWIIGLVGAILVLIMGSVSGIFKSIFKKHRK